jgi:thiosulfate dehydrogenase [quinone] large subunit
MERDTTLQNRDVERAYALLRVTLGLNIAMHGIVRWANGLTGFAASLVAMFQKLPLPTCSVYGFGLALPVLESLIGIAVLLGLLTRQSLIAGMVIILSLIFGSTLHQDWQVAGLQMVYSLIYAVLLAGARFNRYSLDCFPSRPRKGHCNLWRDSRVSRAFHTGVLCHAGVCFSRVSYAASSECGRFGSFHFGHVFWFGRPRADSRRRSNRSRLHSIVPPRCNGPDVTAAAWKHPGAGCASWIPGIPVSLLPETGSRLRRICV